VEPSTLYVDHLLSAPHRGDADRLRFVFVGKPTGGRLKAEEDEHSLQADWFSPAEMEELDLRSPFVERMVALFRRKPGLLPLPSFHTLSEEEKRQERP